MVFSCPDYCFGIRIGVAKDVVNLTLRQAALLNPTTPTFRSINQIKDKDCKLVLPEHAQANLDKKRNTVDATRAPGLLG